MRLYLTIGFVVISTILRGQQKLPFLRSVNWQGSQMSGAKLSFNDSSIITCDGTSIFNENVFTGAIHRYLEQTDSISDFDINEGRKTIACVTGKGKLLLFDYGRNKIISQTDLAPAKLNRRLTLSPSGNKILLTEGSSPDRPDWDINEFIKVQLLDSGLRQLALPFADSGIIKAGFLADNTIIFLLSRNDRSAVMAYYTATGYSQFLADQRSDKLDFAVNNKTNTVTVLSCEGGNTWTVKIFRPQFNYWELLSSSRIPPANWQTRSVATDEVTDQHFFISGNDRVQLWDNTGITAIAEYEIKNENGPPKGIQCSPGGKFISVVYGDNKAAIYTLPIELSKKAVKNKLVILDQRTGNKKEVSQLSFSATGSLLSAGDRDGNMYVFDINIRKKIKYIKAPAMDQYKFNPWYKSILFTNDNGLSSMNLETGVKSDIALGYIDAFDMSPDGLHAAYIEVHDTTVKIKDIRYANLVGISALKVKKLYVPVKGADFDLLKFDQQGKGMILSTRPTRGVNSCLYYKGPSDKDSVFSKIAESTGAYREHRTCFSPNSAMLAIANDLMDTISIYSLKELSRSPETIKGVDIMKMVENLDHMTWIGRPMVSELFFLNDSTLGIACGSTNIFQYHLRTKLLDRIKSETPVNHVVYPPWGEYYFQSNFSDRIDAMNKSDHKRVFTIQNDFLEPLYAAMINRNELLFVSTDHSVLFNMQTLRIDSVYPDRYIGGDEITLKKNLRGYPTGRISDGKFPKGVMADFTTDKRRNLLITVIEQYTNLDEEVVLSLENLNASIANRPFAKKIIPDARFRALDYDSIKGIIYLIYTTSTDGRSHLFRMRALDSLVLPQVFPTISFPENFYVDAATEKAYVTTQEDWISKLKVFSLSTWEQLDSVDIYDASTRIFVDHDNGWIVLGSENGYLSIYDLHDLSLVFSTPAHEGHIISLSVSPGRRLITLGSEGIVKYWDLKTFSLIGSLYFIGNADFIFIDKEGYYMATKDGVKAIAFKMGANVFPVEQLDSRYNRPDIILRQLDSAGNASLIKYYELALKKRSEFAQLQKTSEIDKAGGPEVEYIGAETGKAGKSAGHSVNDSTLFLMFRVSDPVYRLRRVQIWVNNVPLYKFNGAIPAGKRTKDSTFVEKIVLSEGDNKIEISGINEKNVESARAINWVTYQPVTQAKYEPRTYLFTIAVNEYKNPAYNLRYAVNDGRQLTDRMMKLKPGKDLVVDSFYNQRVTRSMIEKIRSRLMHTSVNDKVIILFSGHGTVDTAHLEFYFGTYDIDFLSPEKKGISYNEIENLLSDIPARNKLILIDACHSGLFDKAEKVSIKRDTLEANGQGVIVKNTSEVKKDAGKIGGSGGGDLERKAFELMQDAFWNTGFKDGTFVITASAGDSYAIESPEYRNGVFTYAILKGLQPSDAQKKMQGSGLSVRTLFESIKTEVLERTKNRQKPQLRKEYIDSDWNILE